MAIGISERRTCPWIVTTALVLVSLIPPLRAQAASPAKQCIKNTCKSEKKSCIQGFKAQFASASDNCEKDKPCKKEEKQLFKSNKKRCKQQFAACKTCCKDDPTQACSVLVCGDGNQVAGEECDDGPANSDTFPDACRTNCTRPTCGDRVVDPASGEQCEPPSSGTCGSDCRRVQLGSSTTTTTPSTTTTTLPGAFACPPNPSGGPQALTVTIGAGTDLDLGVSGIAHNTGFIEGTKVVLCLEGCDSSTNPVCTGIGETDTGGKTNTLNGATFGPPLPLLSGGVPVCVVNEYREDIFLGSFDLSTGELAMTVRLTSKVHQTSTVDPAPCPTCGTSGTPAVGLVGRCSGGSNDGRQCIIEGLTVFGPTSSDCPPPALNNVGNLAVDLDLTTGSAALPIDGFGGGNTCLDPPGGVGGLCPCPGQKQRNQCDNENQCNEGGCPSGIEPGVDQLCCPAGSGVDLGCYPGQGATATDIVRTGLAAVPYVDPAGLTGAWPDPRYPKTAADTSLVSVFCIEATQSNIVNNVAGLPGPGATVLPVTVVVNALCGDGAVNAPGEECDGNDDAACPRHCRPDCRCSLPSPSGAFAFITGSGALLD